MKTVLLIEDNKAILDNLTEFLELEGYCLLAASNGKKGVELARQFIPDLILCDILMPELNGREVLDLLLDTVKTHNIPFIFSTSKAENFDIREALKQGANDYIVKPYQLDKLLQMIKSWIT